MRSRYVQSFARWQASPTLSLDMARRSIELNEQANPLLEEIRDMLRARPG